MLPSESVTPLLSLGRLRTQADMTKVATKLALVRDAIRKLGDVEKILAAPQRFKEADVALARSDKKALTSMMAKKTREMIAILNGVKRKMQVYKKVLGHAAN